MIIIFSPRVDQGTFLGVNFWYGAYDYVFIFLLTNLLCQWHRILRNVPKKDAVASGVQSSIIGHIR